MKQKFKTPLTPITRLTKPYPTPVSMTGYPHSENWTIHLRLNYIKAMEDKHGKDWGKCVSPDIAAASW